MNGRGRGNPWSLRQTGVYHRCLSNEQSAWLVLNFSTYVRDRIVAAFGEESGFARGSCEASSILPHLFILTATARNWEPYIEHLRQQVAMLVKLQSPPSMAMPLT